MSPSKSTKHTGSRLKTSKCRILSKNHNLVCPFSSDKRYATTQVKAPPQLLKTGAVRVLRVSHGFVYEPYALHEKISWWQSACT
ncbi:hypothetical protein F2Q69_00019769 [Brassica cretica]|uniref:Uncharacterized protein n=1 Tax=Brassica cretica TaxID=69181 RepID=A0A8S9QPC8_BRACR|nr:hypothetical protein F2Q69_00019769 [Brassica cretica]